MNIFVPRSAYWTDATTPLACLLFLLPWLLIYEGGVLLLSDGDPNGLRNGADYFLRMSLHAVGLTQFLLPVLVILLLLGWHRVQRRPWRLCVPTLGGMLIESVLLAAALLMFGQLHQALFIRLPAAVLDVSAVQRPLGPVTQTVTYVGAGVYEEVLFRLLLLPIVFGILRFFRMSRRRSAVLAAAATAVIFAAAHHVGPAAEAFDVFRFSFRMAAGVFFATVFLLRGFGITVGAHAAYDVMVGVLLAAG